MTFPRPRVAAPRTPRPWVQTAGVVLVLLTGLVLRGWILSSPFGRVDSDEAVTGPMARHFLEGEWSTFYWGSNYGGTIESIIGAPLSLLCNSAVVMKALTILLYGVALVLTWRVGRRTVGEAAAVVAALILWVAPAAFVLISTKTRGCTERRSFWD